MARDRAVGVQDWPSGPACFAAAFVCDWNCVLSGSVGEAEAAQPGLERNALLLGSGLRRHDAPLFAALLRAIAESEDLQRLVEVAPQFGPRLLRSAIHALLLATPEHELAAYFPTIARAALPADEAGPAFISFCKEHRAELEEMVRTRTLQTTSVGRAVEMVLALDEVAKSVGGPFSIVEIGCSAGLLLLFDHYRYEFPDGSTLGPVDAEVVLSPVRFLGRPPRAPTCLPQIVRRVGIDLQPVNLADAAARNWVLGCTAADWVEDFRQLEKALNARARTALDIVAGDAVAALPGILERIEEPVCVIHSRCLYQWTRRQQEALNSLLLRSARDRTLHRIGIERNGPGRDPGDLGGGATHNIAFSTYRDGMSDTRVLGRVSDKDTIEWFVDDGNHSERNDG